MMRAFVLAVALWLSGCTTINPHVAPPADWPALKVTVKKLGFWELQRACGGGGAMFLLQQIMACAAIRLDLRTCTVYYAADDEHGEMAVAHELKHCEGYDHHGSTAARDFWEAWKARGGR